MEANERKTARAAERAGRTARAGAWVLAAAAALVLSVPAGADAQETTEIDETRTVASDVSVELETVNRTVRVTGGDRSELRVRGRYDPDHEEFTIEGDRSSVRIELEPTGERGHLGAGMDDPGPLTLELPRGARLEVDGVNGGITVEDVDGGVELESVNGAIRYTGGAGSVQAETVNGAVDVRAPNARNVRAGSVNGGVTLEVSGGHVLAEAVSGDVEIRATGPVERLRAEAVSGDLSFRGRPASGASFAFETHSGDVVLRLPADLSARLEASSFSGEIESAFGGTPQKEDRWTPQVSFRHTVGSGDVRISAEAFSGDVRFVREGG